MLIAHDTTLESVVDVFPEKANGWRERGWQERGRWRFVRDLMGEEGGEEGEGAGMRRGQ